jgi:hypothetical protein
MPTPARPYGRVFYFGRKQEELRHRAMECALIGNIEPEWDDLVGAEIEAGDNFQRHPQRDLSGN